MSLEPGGDASGGLSEESILWPDEAKDANFENKGTCEDGTSISKR